MCGIVGIVGDRSEAYISHFNGLIQHRGPDDSGIYQNSLLALGHQRLSIQDLSSNGHQPMYSEDGEYLIIYNGEVYNHQEIRKELEDKYTFRSSGDTETILYGFIEYGTALFDKLNGIFALAIYHKASGKLVIVRDQFGVKPLYYYYKDNTLLFGSEIKSFLTYPDIEKTIDHKALVNYINFLWSPGSYTPFREIKKLEAGHYIEVNINDPDSFRIKQYYDIPFDGIYSDKSEEELINELDELLFQAVKRQLLSDVPVGFFLSGGLDSSAVVAMAKKALPNQKLRCYTIDPGEGKGDFEGFANDLHYAKLVAEKLDLDLQIVDGSVDIVSDFDKMIYHLDEPQADPAPLNVLNICKQAREDGFVVLLGGTAGDDLFSGYRRHQALHYEKFLSKIPKPLIGIAQKLSYGLNSKNPLFRRIRKILANADQDALERWTGYYSWLPLTINKSLFNENIISEIDQYDPSELLKEALKKIPKEHSPLNKMLYWDMKYFLTDHNLNYTDKLSMAVGVEVRVPFLDKELVEFSTKLPPELKLKGKTTKYLLKKVMERYLPHEVIYRPKSGFGAPVRKWIISDLDPVIKDYLSEASITRRGIFKADAIHNLIKENKEGKVDASYTIWTLLAMESWFRQFVDKAI